MAGGHAFLIWQVRERGEERENFRAQVYAINKLMRQQEEERFAQFSKKREGGEAAKGGAAAEGGVAGADAGGEKACEKRLPESPAKDLAPGDAHSTSATCSSATSTTGAAVAAAAAF